MYVTYSMLQQVESQNQLTFTVLQMWSPRNILLLMSPVVADAHATCLRMWWGGDVLRLYSLVIFLGKHGALWGFPKVGGTPIFCHPSQWDFPKQKPSSYGGTPIYGNHHLYTLGGCSYKVEEWCYKFLCSSILLIRYPRYRLPTHSVHIAQYQSSIIHFR